MLSCTLTYLPVATVSAFRVFIFLYLFNTACLYEINLGGNKVLSIDFNNCNRVSSNQTPDD